MSRTLSATLLAVAVAVLTGCAQPAPNDPSTLSIGVVDDPPGLDPAEHADPSALGIAGDVFETLVRLRPGTFDVVPGLAQSWSVSSDGATWTFVLRPGAKFSDGTNVDAAAVKANFDRWRLSSDPNRQGLDFPVYPQYFGGVDAQSVIDDVHVDGPSSIVVHTRAPFAPLLRTLTLPSFGIGSPTAFGNDYKLYDELPVASGPYRVAEFQGGDHVTLTPNPEWHGHGPRLPAIVIRTIPDPPTGVLLLEKDDVDALADPPPEVASDIATRSDMRILRWPRDALCYLIFDFDRPPFDEAKARQGVAAAIDRGAIARGFGDPRVRPARGFFLPTMLGDDPAIVPVTHDLRAARALLASAAATPITLYYPATATALLPDPDGIAHEIQNDLSAAGLSVTLSATDTVAIPANLAGGALALGVVEAPSGDPDELLAPLAATWHDPDFSAGVARGRATIDEAARGTVYRQLDALITARSAAVPLAYPARVSAASARATVRLDSALLPPLLGNE